MPRATTWRTRHLIRDHLAALDAVGRYVRLTKSRKDCAQIAANRDSELGYASAIAGCALLLDVLLPFVSPAHRGRITYYSLLAAAAAQLWTHLGWFLGPD